MSLFVGSGVALVTPFHEHGSINFEKLRELVEFHIENGTDALIICGTTGEVSTLTDEDQIECIRVAAETAKGRIPVIGGAGSNVTEHAIYLAQGCEKAGADGLLIVTPYYNKTTQKGLVEHYTAIAESVNIPIILYNVPSRTGVDIPVSVYHELSKIPNIIGVKEASTDITKIAKIRALCPIDFTVWSGNDDMTVPILSLGGRGVISVTSNVLPIQVHAMTQAALAGDFDSAAALQLELLPLIAMLFCEVNPIPVKAAMEILGYDCGACRMPLTALHPEHKKKLKELLLIE